MPDQSQDMEDELEEWTATRLVDERTGNSCIGIDFPRRQSGMGFEVFDDDLAEQPQRVRTLLKRRGAEFSGTKKEPDSIHSGAAEEDAAKAVDAGNEAWSSRA